MYKRTTKIIFLLLASVFLVAILGFTAEAGVNVDTTNKEIQIDDGIFTLDDIWDATPVDDSILWNITDGTWIANYSIVVNDTATLLLNPDDGTVGCTWLKLNSVNTSGKYNAHIDVQGRLFVNDSKVSSWVVADDWYNLEWDGDFRPYIYIHPEEYTDTPWASFLNSTMSYLGFNIDNKYGIVYEDAQPESDDIDAQGWIHNCTVSHNYIGVAFQGCQDMEVTDSYINDSKVAGIVFTTGAVTADGAHGGYVGKNDSRSASYSYVTVYHTVGDAVAANGIRVVSTNNLTFDRVDVINCTHVGVNLHTVNNLDADWLRVTYCTDAASEANICLTGVTNSRFDNCTAAYPDGAASGLNWDIYTGSNNNNFTTCHGNNAVDHSDFELAANVHNNTFRDCTASDSNIGFEIDGTYHEFYTCTAQGETASGFSLAEATSHCTLEGCTANNSNLRGISVSGFDANNNTIGNSTFSGNSFGVFMWPTADSNCADNYFWYCTISNNTQTGVDIGRSPLNYFYECDVFDNTNYGFEIKTNSSTYIFNCDVYNPAASRDYDFYVDNTSNVDIYGKYILGYDKNINYQFDTVQPYGLVAHDAGDGLWTVNTTLMTVYCNDGKDAYVNLTDWTGATYRKWHATGQSGDYLYHKVGGLTAGTLYSLKVDGVSQGTYNAQTETLLRYSTGVVCFNYTGSWSTHYFEITPYVAPDDDDNGNGGGGGGGSGGDGDDTSDTTIPPSTGVDLFVYIAFAAIIIIVGGVLFFWWYNKKK